MSAALSVNKIEQKEVYDFLDKTYTQHRMPHALLFVGERGWGQMEAAQYLAALLFCIEKKSNVPCGECSVCKKIENFNHADLKIKSPEEDSKVIKMEAVREMIQEANLKPFEAPAKVIILEPAEALGETAQNAILKTLEEPPANTYFVLISYEPEKLLTTIRSRVMELRFVPSQIHHEESDNLVKAKAAFSTRLFRGAAATNPDLSYLTREEFAKLMDYAIRLLRESLIMSVECENILETIEDPLPKRQFVAQKTKDEIMDMMEYLTEIKEKVSSSVNMKLANAWLWEKI